MSEQHTAETRTDQPRGMYVHPATMTALVAILSVLATMLVMNHPGGMSGAMHDSGNAATVADAGSLQLYYSTMHPWIVQDHPGTCPICGMELVKMPPEDQAEYLANHPEMM
ncbi:MAG TPA: hypothetical protein ENO21_04945 [Firmicutes bacterium]|nr:hypothetical protein [Bacillota bacterium]